jgi:hypothetical protein
VEVRGQRVREHAEEMVPRERERDERVEAEQCGPREAPRERRGGEVERGDAACARVADAVGVLGPGREAACRVGEARLEGNQREHVVAHGGGGWRRSGCDRDGIGVGAVEVVGDLVLAGREDVDALLEDVGRLLEQPTPVVGDDGRLTVLLVGVVASHGSGLSRNEVAPGGLLHDILLGKSPLRIELEELVEFAEFVKDDLGGRRELGRDSCAWTENRWLWYQMLEAWYADR